MQQGFADFKYRVSKLHSWPVRGKAWKDPSGQILGIGDKCRQPPNNDYRCQASWPTRIRPYRLPEAVGHLRKNSVDVFPAYCGSRDSTPGHSSTTTDLVHDIRASSSLNEQEWQGWQKKAREEGTLEGVEACLLGPHAIYISTMRTVVCLISTQLLPKSFLAGAICAGIVDFFFPLQLCSSA